MKRNRLPALLLALSLLLCLAACAAPGGTPATDAPVTAAPATAAPATAAPEATPVPATAEPAPTTREFTDSTGRTVTLPAEITRIAVSGPLTQIAVFALAPDLLVGISNAWDPGAEDYFAPQYYNLPILGQLYGGKGEMNLEELLAADPDLVLDVGEAKDSIREDMDKLTEQTGIPFLHIDAHTDTMGEAFRTLGDLLGLEAEAAPLADYCDQLMAKAESVLAQVGEENKVRALYLLGDTGLNVIARGSYHAEIIDLLTENLAVVDSPSSKGTGNETDMEQLLLWDPDFIIFSYDSIADQVGEDPSWQQLTAIQNGNYAKAPYGPYNWMGFPPSVQRYLGVLWLLDTLYPEAAQLDLRSEVDRYYDLFYHCALTDAQYEGIVGSK